MTSEMVSRKREGGELEDDELLGAVIHYNPTFHLMKRLELLVTNFELEEWSTLVKLRDGTGYAGCGRARMGVGTRLRSTRTQPNAAESQWMRVGRSQTLICAG
jgi:hypothetical protein